MTWQKIFLSLSRRIMFIEHRLWNESQSDQRKELIDLCNQFQTKLTEYYGKKIAWELLYKQGEK